MKASKSIIKIITAVVSAAAVITALIVFRKQLCDVYSRIKGFVQRKMNKLNRPAEYDDFADV